MATPRNRQYRPGGSGGNGEGLGAILAALVGAPGLEGGESLQELAGPEDTQGILTPMDKTPYTVQKPTLGQRIFNPRGVNQSQYMADMLKFEDYQNQLKSGLVGQHNAGQLELEKLRSVGNIAEREASERIKKDEFARSLGLPSWEHAKAILSDPDVQTSVLKRIYADNDKQQAENELTRANANDPSKRFLNVSKDSAAFNPETGFTFFNQAPMFEEPIPGGAGGLRTTRLPVDGGRSGGGGINFVRKPGGVAAEIGSFNNGEQPPVDVSEIGNIFQSYNPQGSGSNPTVSGPTPAPKTTPSSNPFAGLGSKLLTGALKPFQDTANYIKSIPAPPVNTGQFKADFVDPVKSLLNNIIGESPRPTPNPNAYEDYVKGQIVPPASPSAQPVVEPPNILEQMKLRRQLLFPTPIQSYPYGR